MKPYIWTIQDSIPFILHAISDTPLYGIETTGKILQLLPRLETTDLESKSLIFLPLPLKQSANCHAPGIDIYRYKDITLRVQKKEIILSRRIKIQLRS